MSASAHCEVIHICIRLPSRFIPPAIQFALVPNILTRPKFLCEALLDSLKTVQEDIVMRLIKEDGPELVMQQCSCWHLEFDKEVKSLRKLVIFALIPDRLGQNFLDERSGWKCARISSKLYLRSQNKCIHNATTVLSAAKSIMCICVTTL